MKFLLPLLPLFAVATASAATTTEYAKVVSATPVYERSITQHCEDIPVTQVEESTEQGRTTGAVVGGLLGGVVGHQFGGGHGKTAATVAGAIAGSLAGRSLADRPSVSTSTRRECHDVAHSELTGYSVVYEFRGTRGTVQMPYDPGNRLEMQVSIEPVIR